MGRQVADLQNIILTHGHRSHLGGARTLKEQSGATVYAHEWEADIVAGERKAHPVSLVPQRPLRAYFPLQVGLALGIGKHPPCPVDHHLSDGDRIGPLEVFHAPGTRRDTSSSTGASGAPSSPATRSRPGRRSPRGGRPSTSIPSSIATRFGGWPTSTARSWRSATASPSARTAAVRCATSRTHSSATLREGRSHGQTKARQEDPERRALPQQRAGLAHRARTRLRRPSDDPSRDPFLERPA